MRFLVIWYIFLCASGSYLVKSAPIEEKTTDGIEKGNKNETPILPNEEDQIDDKGGKKGDQNYFGSVATESSALSLDKDGRSDDNESAKVIEKTTTTTKSPGSDPLAPYRPPDSQTNDKEKEKVIEKTTTTPTTTTKSPGSDLYDPNRPPDSQTNDYESGNVTAQPTITTTQKSTQLIDDNETSTVPNATDTQTTTPTATEKSVTIPTIDNSTDTEIMNTTLTTTQQPTSMIMTYTSIGTTIKNDQTDQSTIATSIVVPNPSTEKTTTTDKIVLTSTTTPTDLTKQTTQSPMVEATRKQPKKLASGATAGIIVAVLAVFVLVGGVFYYFKSRRVTIDQKNVMMMKAR